MKNIINRIQESGIKKKHIAKKLGISYVWLWKVLSVNAKPKNKKEIIRKIKEIVG